jgi:hypothetical protein
MIECLVNRSLRDLIEHHPKSGLGGTLRHNLFGQMLADCFAFAVRVSCEIDSVCFFGGLLQLGNDLFIITLSSIGNYFIGRFEIVVNINSQSFRRQIFNMTYRGLNQIVLTQVFINCLGLCRRLNYD